MNRFRYFSRLGSALARPAGFVRSKPNYRGSQPRSAAVEITGLRLAPARRWKAALRSRGFRTQQDFPGHNFSVLGVRPSS